MGDGGWMGKGQDGRVAIRGSAGRETGVRLESPFSWRSSFLMIIVLELELYCAFTFTIDTK